MKRAVLTTIKNILKQDLIHGSAILFIGSTIASFIAFLFNLILAHNISVAEYGVFASLVSLISFLVTPSGFITTLITQFATTFFAQQDEEKAEALYKRSFILLSGLALIIIICFTVGAHFIQLFLKINSFPLVFVSGISIAFSYIYIVNSAYLQSTLKFGYSALNQIISNLFKLIAGSIFIFMNLKSLAGILAVNISYLSALVISGLPFLKYFLVNTKNIQLPRKDIVGYSFPAFFAILGFSSFITTDVILSKHFLSDHEAGLYAGLSLMGRVIFYFTAPIPSVMFPLIIKKHVQNENFRHLFLAAIGIVSLLSLSVVVFYSLFPTFAIKIFLGGGAYLAYSRYLWLFGIYATIFSLLSVLINFYLSLKKMGIAFFVGFAALLQISMITFFHKSAMEILIISTIIASTLFVCLLLYYIYSYERKKTA